MDEIIRVHQCLFCPQTFGSASEKDDHILQHFAQETCIECDQNLIRIGNNLYTKHNAVTCIKVNIKTEDPIYQEDQHETIDEKIDEHGFTAVTSLDSMLAVEIKPDLIALNEQLMLANENSLVENCEYELDSTDASEAASEATSNNDNKCNECNICGKMLSSKDGLKKHISITHSAPGHFPCEICPNLVFTRKDSLRKHNQMKHDPNTVKFKCNFCQNVFLHELSLEKHLPKCKKRIKKTRFALNQEYTLENQLYGASVFPTEQMSHSNQLAEPTGESTSQDDSDLCKCNICGKILSNIRSLKVHETLTHSAPGHFPCEICPNMIFTRKDSLRKHMQMKHDPNCVKYKCNFCSSVFLKEISLESHLFKCNKRMKRMEGELSTVISEDMCTVQIKEEDTGDYSENTICTPSIEIGSITQNEHSSVTNPNGNDNECDICLKTFFDKNGVQQHKNRVHSVCACTKIFATAEALAEHKAICEFKKRSRVPLIYLGKTFECHLCHRVIKDIVSLRKHMLRKHFPCEKKHNCEKCGKRFLHLYELRNHNESVHLKIRKYLCTSCGKSFLCDQALRIHMNKHTGETPYKCPLCEKAFSNPTVRNMHIRTHTEERNFKCPYEGCDKRFKTPANVYKHKKKMHGYKKKEQSKDT
ncbi:zinc finger protein 62 homolog [Contarinia nasturtii]|uniref:zinc finger protein 62 homolog n=1 Tax=Contarinia nasturtii TaxID=265458 RepID=UPI0012D4134D|nr:zinc finger protein 62 homolog [Contarinia nasturtii]